jgi:hypothetical protein
LPQNIRDPGALDGRERSDAMAGFLIQDGDASDGLWNKNGFRGGVIPGIEAVARKCSGLRETRTAGRPGRRVNEQDPTVARTFRLVCRRAEDSGVTACVGGRGYRQGNGKNRGSFKHVSKLLIDDAMTTQELG